MGLDGRLMLVKQVLSAMLVFQTIALAQPIWLHKFVDKIRRGFLWECKEVVVGGKCLVSWKLVCRLKMYWGLGISNLQAQGMALRLRWLWQSWNEPDKPWACLPMTVDKKLNDLFNASVKFVLGNGERIKFWYEPWLNGVSLSCAVPTYLLAALAKTSWCPKPYKMAVGSDTCVALLHQQLLSNTQSSGRRLLMCTCCWELPTQ